MKLRTALSVVLGLVVSSIVLAIGGTDGEGVEAWRPEIPRTWDEEALKGLEVPLVVPEATPVHASAEYYYSIPVRTIYQSYPIYHPDHEPPGYLEWLRAQEPRVAFDPAQLVTREDWQRAGERVFEAPILYDALNSVEEVRSRDWYEETTMPVTGDGIMPFNVYVIREKGKVEVGEFSCATCHIRVMPDGSVIKGAQGNYPLGRLDAIDTRQMALAAEDPATVRERFVHGLNIHYGAPWLGERDPQKAIAGWSLEELAEVQDRIPPGVQARFGTSFLHPVQVPDLIGVRERRYLDRTGHVRHRDIGDLMRYAALNQGQSFNDRFGDFYPYGRLLRPTGQRRYSDEQLYALGLYLYSLEPPPNPHPFDELAAAGKELFAREACYRCHTPSLYTNNALIPVDGFTVPLDHPQRKDIRFISVGTDPSLTLGTRRGTGLYKVPSLKGVWYRGPLQHSGAAGSLEEWFNPERVEEEYRPEDHGGFGTGPIQGHPFGLDLTAEERRALIAFLRTL